MLFEHTNAVRLIYYNMWDSICCMFYCTNLCRKTYRRGHEFLQHLQGLKVFCCSGIPHAWFRSHMYGTNEMETRDSALTFHCSSLHVGGTPAASYLRCTAAPQVTELIAHFHPQHESRLMTSSTLPFSGFCVKWHTERSVANDTYRPLFALFALHNTQPPTSSESGSHQL